MQRASKSGRLHEELIRAARAGEPDRYLSALLAPVAVRADLIALAAFTAEINKIARVVREPHLAEIRLQWWRDTVLASPRALTGNPIADALTDTLDHRGISRDIVDNWLDAFAVTLYPAPPEDAAQLGRVFEQIEGTPFLLAALICAEPTAPVDDEEARLARQAGIAYGLARLGLAMAHSLALGRMPLPENEAAGFDTKRGERDWARAKAFIAAAARGELAPLKRQFPHVTPALRTALLPVALVEPYLRVLERPDHDVRRDLGDVAPLARIWRLWRAKQTKRI